MNQNYSLRLLWLALILAGGLLGCGPVPDSSAVAVASAREEAEVILVDRLPTEAVLVTLVVPSPVASFTPIPTASPTAVSQPATSTPNPTITPTATATIHPQHLLDRSCQQTIPLKPIYNREIVGENWLAPGETFESHLWLQKPLPGGGRYLHNTSYPYGHDGNGTYLLHNGIDSGAPLGTPVLAAGEGEVLFARSDEFELHGWRCNWYGNFIVLELERTWQGQPIYALYAHLDELQVREGERVTAGQEIGTVGMSGVAVQPHLHFEVRVGENDFGTTRNPMLWVQLPETRGVLAGRLLDPQNQPWQGVVVTAIGWEGSDNQHVTWTYLDDPTRMINPDEALGENFLFADLTPGLYRIQARVQGQNYQMEAQVVGGQVTTVELRTEPYRPPTATPEISLPLTTTLTISPTAVFTATPTLEPEPEE